MSRSWSAHVFDAVYAAADDPWRYAASAYERSKYRATFAALGRRRFRAALEAGCSIGVFTRALARRCSTLLATDCAAAALRQARHACAGQRHVRFRQAMLPRDWPRAQRFDLILFSEILYYLSPADLRRIARRAAASLRPGGLVLLVNYTGPTNSPQTGHRAAAGFTSASELRRTFISRRGRYRIDRFAHV